MANLGSELIRFFNLKKQGRQSDARLSAERARQLITKIKATQTGGGAKEAEILESVLDDALLDIPQYRVTEAELNSYFAPFVQRVLAS